MAKTSHFCDSVRHFSKISDSGFFLAIATKSRLPSHCATFFIT
nr:MAG TPA: hypothetical protein [Caudoviricetes sp.]